MKYYIIVTYSLVGGVHIFLLIKILLIVFDPTLKSVYYLFIAMSFYAFLICSVLSKILSVQAWLQEFHRFSDVSNGQSNIGNLIYKGELPNTNVYLGHSRNVTHPNTDCKPISFFVGRVDNYIECAHQCSMIHSQSDRYYCSSFLMHE